MKAKLTYEFDDKVELNDYLEQQRENKNQAIAYTDLYNWARGVWKYSDKETITVDELQRAFVEHSPDC